MMDFARTMHKQRLIVVLLLAVVCVLISLYLTLAFPLVYGGAYWLVAICAVAIVSAILAAMLFNFRILFPHSSSDLLNDDYDRQPFMEDLSHALELARKENHYCVLLVLSFAPLEQFGANTRQPPLSIIQQHVFARTKNCVNETDLVARIGDAEVAVLLASLPRIADTERKVQEIVRELDAPYTADGKPAGFVVSAGIAIYPFNGADAEQLAKVAEDAMYCAKSGNSSRCCFASREYRQLNT